MGTSDDWRPLGASDHAGWKIVAAVILAVSNRTANASVENIDAEQKAVRAVNEMLAPDKRGSVVAAVRADLLSRSELGIAKYGQTLDRNDLSLRDWLQHAYEETLDQANYLKRAIMEIDDAASRP